MRNFSMMISSNKAREIIVDVDKIKAIKGMITMVLGGVDPEITKLKYLMAKIINHLEAEAEENGNITKKEEKIREILGKVEEMIEEIIEEEEGPTIRMGHGEVVSEEIEVNEVVKEEDKEVMEISEAIKAEVKIVKLRTINNHGIKLLVKILMEPKKIKKTIMDGPRLIILINSRLQKKENGMIP
jgi:hypothetical protein